MALQCFKQNASFMNIRSVPGHCEEATCLMHNVISDNRWFALATSSAKKLSRFKITDDYWNDSCKLRKCKRAFLVANCSQTLPAFQKQ